MVKYKKFVSIIFISLIIFSCKSNINLDKWQGKYSYEEVPVKANAEYSMVMVWDLSIRKSDNQLIGELEINGQQMFCKIAIDAVADEHSLKIIFDKLIDGNEFKDLQKGDLLFSLNQKNDQLITSWKKSQPLLLETFQNDTINFIKEK